MCDVGECVFFSFPFFSAIDVECETFYDIDSVGAPPFIAATTINAKMKMISSQSSLSDITSFVLFQFNA